MQARFSLLTFLAQEEVLEQVTIVTDAPEYYKSIENQKVVIEEVSQEKVRLWKGKENLIYRTKIKALEFISEQYPNYSLLFVDTDTFLFGDLSQVKNLLEENYIVMDFIEDLLCEIKTKSGKSLWRNLKNFDFQKFYINQNNCLWNGGVVGIPQKILKEGIELSLFTCDLICQSFGNKYRITEQLAFSLALNELGDLKAADQEIGHYFGNKTEWKIFIQDFFCKASFSGLTENEKIQTLNKLELNKLLPVNLKIPKTRERLIKLAEKIFPEKLRKYSGLEF